MQAIVEKEAAKHQNDVTMVEDENKAVLHAMEGAALVWGIRTYKRLDHATQQQVQPGLKLRLDRIDSKYLAELTKLLSDRAAWVLRELDVDG